MMSRQIQESSRISQILAAVTAGVAGPHDKDQKIVQKRTHLAEERAEIGTIIPQ